MNSNAIIETTLFFGLGIALTPPLGRYMYKVFTGEKTLLTPLVLPIEKLCYKLTGVDPKEEMTWLRYLWAVVICGLVGVVALMTIFMTQQWEPHFLNPQGLPNLPWNMAFNEAWSFVCNADWQDYSGESTYTYFAQICGVMVHQFISGSTGLAILVACGRALKRASTKSIGNFWVDVTRCLLYITLPLSALFGVFLASQGVPQTLGDYPTATLVEPYNNQIPKVDDKGNPVTTTVPVTESKPKLDASGKPVLDDKGQPVMVDVPKLDDKGQPVTTTQPVMVDNRVDTQTIPIGAVASFESIKQLFTNGGGWYGVNSAHPYENPTPFADFLELLAIIIVPMAQVYMFGLLVANTKHAWCLFAVMLVLYLMSFGIGWWAESQPNPVLGAQYRPLMEGKEVRNGVENSVLWAVSCTAIDNGSVNCMHDSLMPLAGLMPMWNIMIGEMLFGGIGCGMYCMLFHVLITVFICGLMIGRTPEYLGKKLGAWEATWAVIGVLLPNAAALIPAAFACVSGWGQAGLTNHGPHGLSEILYAYAEAANNNGSAFAGLTVNTVPYDLTLGLSIIIGRFAPIVAALAIVGNLASKKTVEASVGTLPTHGWTFGFSLAGVIIIVAALTFFPALLLGPFIEHGLMLAGRAY
jgi:potassium-transporting ATPase potassium-binding subunit